MKRIAFTRAAIAFSTIVSFALLSPKWMFWPVAFIAPGLMIYLVKGLGFWKGYFLCATLLFFSHLIASYRVMPFPTIIFLLMIVQISLFAAVPYALSRVLSRNMSGAMSTLVFPCCGVLLEYANSFLGGGTWGSIAYSQMDNVNLIQISAITGIWGVSFLVYWFASLSVWALTIADIHRVKWPVAFFFAVVICSGLYGFIKTTPYFHDGGESVRVAGISATNLNVLGTVYQNAFGKPISFDPATINYTSPELSELNMGLAEFVKDPFNKKFENAHRALEDSRNQMFDVAAREAKAGAKIISFSEALFFTFKPVENELIRKGQTFAAEHNITLFLPIASFIPGQIRFGSTYVENKIVTIDSSGTVVNVFFKNKPVPVVEGSVAGDGTIPLIRIGESIISPSICYDADFPSLIRKAGKAHTDILILPSGDWREISPYHSQMAQLRAIENGFSLLRPASGAASVACDYHGRILAYRDFNYNGATVITAHLPWNGRPTFYGFTGDYFPVLCALALTAFLIAPAIRRLTSFGAGRYILSGNDRSTGRN